VILATTQVEDFRPLLEDLLDKGADKRRQHGSKGSTVFRDPNETDRSGCSSTGTRTVWQELRLRPRGAADHSRRPGTRAPQAAELGGRLTLLLGLKSKPITPLEGAGFDAARQNAPLVESIIDPGIGIGAAGLWTSRRL